MLIGYRYMLKEVAKALTEDNITFGELARRLNLSQEKLKDLLETMEDRGDIESSCADEQTSVKKKCSGCAMGSACCDTGVGFTAGKTYRLTEQGKKECSK
ncbi:Lrp/AsnC family transcriptional regulator [Methanolobus sp. ZRKC2]|uniref:FeoC-like transcriptional regulator n=1 Tax=Methanolobus sp. ZRKC2 TaxID=3125783 RepID=UPI0032517B7A